MTDTMTSNQVEGVDLGPIDLLAMEFPSTNFTGEILGSVHELVEAGTIRVIDLVIIAKDDAGSLYVVGLHDLGPEASQALVLLHASINQMITLEDIEAIGEELAPNSTAAIMLWENVWALKTKQAMERANGRVIAFERIPHEAVRDALEDLAALAAQAA
jgi:hypothetical protein